MDIYEFAMQMEKDGEDFYRYLVTRNNHKGIVTILNMLADEEVKHYNIIKTMKNNVLKVEDTTILDRAKNIFIQIKEGKEKFDFDTKEIPLYRQAQDIELKSKEFYLEQAHNSENENHKQVFFKLSDEENRHFFLLDNIIEFVQRPERWLENAEFYHLEKY